MYLWGVSGRIYDYSKYKYTTFTSGSLGTCVVLEAGKVRAIFSLSFCQGVLFLCTIGDKLLNEDFWSHIRLLFLLSPLPFHILEFYREKTFLFLNLPNQKYKLVSFSYCKYISYNVLSHLPPPPWPCLPLFFLLLFFVRASAFRTGAASSTDRENVKFFIDSVGSTVKLVSVLKHLSIVFCELKFSKMLTESSQNVPYI